MSWLGRLLSGGFLSPRRPSPDQLAPGNEVRSGEDLWRVTAVLVYRTGADEWPALKLVRGPETIWAGLEASGGVRYDPLPSVDVSEDGRARWDGRVYALADAGEATVTRAVGDVDAAVGARVRYQTLTSDGDPDRWLSVERWDGGYTEVSAARAWRIDRIVRPGAG